MSAPQTIGASTWNKENRAHDKLYNMASAASTDAGGGSKNFNIESSPTLCSIEVQSLRDESRHHEGETDLFAELVDRTKHFRVPTHGRPFVRVLLGLLNCVFFGVGMIISGALREDPVDVLIGALQLCLPFIGWCWAVIWGILMIYKVCHPDVRR
eukprot:Blabericola_migrator_1__6954@NODE_3523_length_1708_cov_117_929311_g2188_i0_p1_GENE_NODE_3523_length_1708_cov_117_929311_g2188_i0NODE_3523_length_1708_cov_117_929311_g2188_i0_p1_ORF_typecomplete_len155_score8_52Spec3/PF15795_5/0_0056_NODE_3523_length_1708_cov_117_929311_g2188_i05881052